jgi:BlaI family transcriptional regulator, penicillinase repressor
LASDGGLRSGADLLFFTTESRSRRENLEPVNQDWLSREAGGTGDPSLRLKRGFARDDADSDMARWNSNCTTTKGIAFLTVLNLSVTHCNATMTNIMTNVRKARLKNMGEVEQLVMDYIWAHGPSSSEACREGLAASRPMKDSTIRTVLRRLEEKGFLSHETEGRTFIYKASDARQNVAVRAVKAIIDRFCGGSAEQLVLGMVDNAVLNRKQLERLARKISEKTNPERTAAGKAAAAKREG